MKENEENYTSEYASYMIEDDNKNMESEEDNDKN